MATSVPAETVDGTGARRGRVARLLMIAAVSLGWWFGPKPLSEKDYCGRRIEVGALLGITINCDSIQLCTFAADPALLLAPKALWQSRPVYILLGTTLGHPFAVILQWLFPAVDPRAGYYIGFVVLNFVLLVAAVEVFAKLLTSVGVRSAEVFALSVFLVANDVTKAFLWTAHTQLLGLAAPIFSLAVASRLRRSSRLSVVEAAAWGGLFGIGTLAYGAFIVGVATCGLGMLLRTCSSREKPLASSCVALMFFGLAALTPGLAWTAYVRSATGSFYSHEVAQWRQFVWLSDALSLGFPAAVTTTVHNLTYFALTLASPEVFAPALLMLGVVWCSPRRTTTAGPGASDRQAIATDVTLYLVCAFAFLALMGFYVVRLTFWLVPPLVLAAGLSLPEMSGNRRRRVDLILSAAAACWLVFHLVKRGPFS